MSRESKELRDILTLIKSHLKFLNISITEPCLHHQRSVNSLYTHLKLHSPHDLSKSPLQYLEEYSINKTEENAKLVLSLSQMK